MADEQRKSSQIEPAAADSAATATPAHKAAQAGESGSSAARAPSSHTETAADSHPVNLPDFAAADGSGNHPAALGLLDDVTLRVKIELGRTQMYVEDVLRLNTNSVVELDKAAGDPVDIYVNDRHVARGEVLVLNENFCVRVSEIIQQVGPDD